MAGQNDYCLQRLALGFGGQDWLAFPSVLSSCVRTGPEMRQPGLPSPSWTFYVDALIGRLQTLKSKFSANNLRLQYNK